MSYETCQSGGEKVIELDQDNRKKYGEGEKKEPLKKTGVRGRSTPPRSPTRGFDGA